LTPERETRIIGAAEGHPDVVVRTRGLTKRYGRRTVVDDLTLDIGAGEIFGLLGPNGAGKTTTLLMLLGLSEPSAGSAEVLGLDPLRRPLEIKAQVGYLAENMGVHGDLTARQSLDFICDLNRLSGDSRIVDEVLEVVGLTEAADRRTAEFSRGMRQRLGLAEVLVKNPRLVFLDEPTLGLDPDGIATMLELIGRLPAERGLTVILSSHLLHLVSRVADRVGVLDHGRLLAIGGIGELAERSGVEPDLELVYRSLFRTPEAEARP
jgi:ABC-2 type transport system ATP-binding protein